MNNKSASQDGIEEIREEVYKQLKEIQSKVVNEIGETVKMDYEQRIYEQNIEIEEIKERVKSLEETISWAAYSFKKDI